MPAVPIRLEFVDLYDSIRSISLSRGLAAIVDEDDYVRLAGYRWYAHLSGRNFYAQRHPPAGQPGMIYMHREVLRVNQTVDHINGDSLDNRKANLRVATKAQNAVNSAIRPHSSRFRGVNWFRRNRLWVAHITEDGRTRHLGNFDTEEDAARTYDWHARRVFGEFARLNFPDDQPILPARRGG